MGYNFFSLLLSRLIYEHTNKIDVWITWAARTAYNSLPAIASFVIHYELRTEQTSHALLWYFCWAGNLVYMVRIISHANEDHDDDDDVDDVRDDKRVVAWRGNDVFGALFCGLWVFCCFFYFRECICFCRSFFFCISLSACGRSVLNARANIKIIHYFFFCAVSSIIYFFSLIFTFVLKRFFHAQTYSNSTE